MQTGEAYRFGPFVLDTARMAVLRNDEEVRLRPKAFTALLVLLRACGRVVSKDELVAAVWPNVIVNDDALAQCVRDVRKAIGDTGEDYVRTVSRRGYMFVHPVVLEKTLSHPSIHSNAALSPEAGETSKTDTFNSEAYQAYLQGRYGWSQRSEEASRQALEQFRKAIEIAPQFALAHSGLADCYVTIGKASYIPSGEAFPAAMWHATKALELDATLHDAHASLGFVKLYFERDWRGAETEFQRAIALNPRHAVTHEWYSVFLLLAGRSAEAFREIHLACQLEPLSYAINSTLAFHHYFAGEYKEAAKLFRLVLEMNSQFQPAHLWLGRTYQELGMFEEAFEQFRWVKHRAPEWSVVIAARGFLLGISGSESEARHSLAELRKLAAHRYIASYNVALVEAALGDPDAAFASLEKAVEERSNWLVWLRLDPRWRVLHTDARFGDLLSRVTYSDGSGKPQGMSGSRI